MRSTFKVLFYLKRNAPKKNGLVPVMCRITVNGKIAQFSCKLDVEEKSWNVELGRVSGRSVVAQEANRMLDKIRVGINQAYQKIADRDNYVTAEKVRNAYLGLGLNHETLLSDTAGVIPVKWNQSAPSKIASKSKSSGFAVQIALPARS